MSRYSDCIKRIADSAGRKLTDDEILAVFERVSNAAKDIRAERVNGKKLGIGMGKEGAQLRADIKAQGNTAEGKNIIQEAAQRAAADLEAEASRAEKNAELQLIKLGARQGDVENSEARNRAPLDAVEDTIARDYTGKLDTASLEQKATGYRDWFNSRLLATWDALGSDYLGFFQDRAKLLDLIRELRGEDTGNALAKKGAKAFHDVAEEARQIFNDLGGNIGKLIDWAMPQHHSQFKVGRAGREAWVEKILPKLNRDRYVDKVGQPMDDAQMREFMGHAWDSIATNGTINIEPGKSQGTGKRANRHAESRQIHFKDAESLIDYWNEFGELTALEILHGHIDVMARDIAFIDHFGPNPNITYQTLRDQAILKVAQQIQAAGSDPNGAIETARGRAVGLDNLYNYASGNTKPTYRRWLRNTADAIANLNVAGKLGGAALASLFGDKPMMEAVRHMNDMPALQSWRAELSLLNPANKADRRLIQQQGLMVDNIRSGLQRFYEGLGQSGRTGRLANAVMRITGMQAINDIRKASFGLNAMAAIGNQLAAKTPYAELGKSDVRLLKTWGITERDWSIWQMAKLDTLAGVDNVLTPEAIGRITDADLQANGITAQVQGAATDLMTEGSRARREAIVKLLGVVNTESEFAIVTPGWRERATFYGAQQRGTVFGEMTRSMLQFKAFPWALFKRAMDAVANQDAPTSKAIMASFIIASTTLAGAMLMQTRQMLTGKDPLAMGDKNWKKFWGQAFVYGGALGIYGDFLWNASETRMGSGPIEALSGPTMGPLLELFMVQPMQALSKSIEGKETHLGARTLQDLKGFVPGNNIWYTKAALDHLVWQRVMEMASPGYLAMIRQRTQRDYNQQWYWRPGEAIPERPPNIGKMFER